MSNNNRIPYALTRQTRIHSEFNIVITPDVKISFDKNNVVIPFLCHFLLNSEINGINVKLWVHGINKNRTKNNTIFNFLAELRKDELKFKIFTSMTSTTSDFIFNKIDDTLKSRHIFL